MDNKREQFEKDNVEMLSGLSLLGWNLSEDPMEARLSMMLFQEDPDFVHTVRLAVNVTHECASGWTTQTSDWEMSEDPLIRIARREEFVTGMMVKGADSEYVRYAKKRWERAEFSSVSEGFLTIGDVSVGRRFAKVPLKDEVDVNLAVSNLGRDSVTYSVWKQTEMAKKISAFRMKINGERFVANKHTGRIEGYKQFVMPKGFVPELIEEYAGVFFVLHPMISHICSYDIVGEGKVDFHPHPWMTASSLMNIPNMYSHRYDGIMIHFEGREFRVKWEPTVEVLRGKEVWEVKMDVRRQLVGVRNRPGKVAAQETSSSVVGRIQSCVPASSIVPFIQKVAMQAIDVLPESLQPEKFYQCNEGSKVLFLVPGGKMLMIREPGKRLDFVGGVIEEGETPLDALIREVFEELQVTMLPEQFVYLGVTKEQTDTTTWQTTMFLAHAPVAAINHVHAESFVLKDGLFSKFKNSSEGRPRQVWVARHLDFLSDSLRDRDQAKMMLFMHGINELAEQGATIISFPKKIVPNRWVQDRSMEVYRQILLQKINVVGGDTYENFLRLANVWAPIMKHSAETTSMSTSALSSSPHVVQHSVDTTILSSSSSLSSVKMVGDTVAFPMQKMSIGILLSNVFGWKNGEQKKDLPAQDYYKKIHQMGGPSGRSLAMKWIEGLAAAGFVVINPAIDGRGRVFSLTPLGQDLIMQSEQQSLTLWGREWIG